MMHLGGGELLIILLIVVVLFGAGRITRLGGELGSGIREFRRGIKAEETTSVPAEPPTHSVR